MAAEKSSIAVAMTKFFTNLFHNLTKLLLTNLLFAVPFALFFAIFWAINTFSGINSMFILFLTAIPVFPFYAGVVQVTSHMVRGEENVDVLHNFIAGVKENFKRFIIHGIVFYMAIFFSYFSITMYTGFGKENNIFYGLLVVTVLISIFFLFVFFYVPSMTVTFDLSMKNIYKNSALMSFGEIKHNLFALLGLIILVLFCATILFCCYTGIALIIATIILALFIVPSITSYIINWAVYQTMFNMIVRKDEKTQSIDRKMERVKKGQFFDDDEVPQKKIDEELLKLDIDESGNGDEYIFFNGKMVKRSVLIKLKKEAEKELS